jgi:hypothetical protein
MIKFLVGWLIAQVVFLWMWKRFWDWVREGEGED